MPSFAILRLSKHKTAGTIRAASSHMLRSVETPNANADLTPENITIVGDPDQTPADAVESKLDEIEQRRGKPHGKNRVRAVEVLMTASPEWWANATPEQQAEWRTASTKWLTTTFGKTNVVSLIEHRDETSPHITGFIVPEDPDSGRLNAGRWLDGRVKLQRLQDGYAEAVASLGLDRGLQGSKAKHQRVSRHYANVNRMFDAEPNIPAPRKPGLIEDKEEWAKEQQEKARKAALRTIQPLADKALAYEREKIRADEAEAALKKARAKSDYVRALPLPEVIKALGLEQDPNDKKQWRDPERRMRITLEGRKWYDHNAQQGGGGAIDLAKHTLDADFSQAVSWLADKFGADDTARDVAADALWNSRITVHVAQKDRPPFKAPGELDQDIAREFLASRGLFYENEDGTAIFPLPTDIKTDARNNIAFLMRDNNGQVRGAELKGTGRNKFTGLALGSSREAHFVHEVHDPGPTGYRLGITESAIDALSHGAYARTEKNPNGAKFVSTSGARSTLTKTLHQLAQHAAEIIVAYDWDKAGQRAATLLVEALKAAFPQKTIRNWMPPAEIRQGKDVNDVLMTDMGLRQPDPVAPKNRARNNDRGRGMGD